MIKCYPNAQVGAEIEAIVREVIGGCLSAEVDEPLLPLDEQIEELAAE